MNNPGLYIHIPFCHSKCSYCDFFSTPAMLQYQDRYISALLKEVELRKHEMSKPFDTVYIGGGTPSILSKEAMSMLLKGIKKYVPDNIREFTIEVNPEDVTAELLDLYASFGVNRISMGVQTFDDESLKLISRRHTSEKACEAINLLRIHNMNYSCDLIYGLPTGNSKNTSFEVFSNSLEQLLSFNPPHFSAYLLSFEHSTKMFAQRERGEIVEISDEEAIKTYQYLCDTAKSAGYNHYEISNFAIPGKEAIHNSKYWNLTPYLGVGCSAHSFDGKLRRYNPNKIVTYIDTVLNTSNTFYITEETDAIEQYNDLIITALRTSNGLDSTIIEKQYPKYISDYFSEMSDKLLNNDKLQKFANKIIIPENLWLTADNILRELIYVE